MNAHYIGSLRSMWERKEAFISWSRAGFLVHYSSKVLLRAQTNDRKGRFAIYLNRLQCHSYYLMIYGVYKRKISVTY